MFWVDGSVKLAFHGINRITRNSWNFEFVTSTSTGFRVQHFHMIYSNPYPKKQILGRKQNFRSTFLWFHTQLWKQNLYMATAEVNYHTRGKWKGQKGRCSSFWISLVEGFSASYLDIDRIQQHIFRGSGKTPLKGAISALTINRSKLARSFHKTIGENSNRP